MFTLTIEDKNGVIADEFCFNHGTYLIGRVEGNDIILPSSKVSRQHARIFVRDNHCFVEDLGSSNGVIVDGQRIQGERDLGTASQIRIGDFYLYLALNKDQDNNQHDVVSTHIVSQDENSYKLVRVGDGFAGEFFPLAEAQNSVGRTEDNTIFLNDPSVSRRHARVDYDGLVYTLHDLGSSNGSSINDKRVSSPAILREGDRISFGNLHFVFMPSSKHLSPGEYIPPTQGSSGKGGGGGMSAVTIIIGAAVVFFLFLGCVGAAGGGYYFYSKQQTAVAIPEPPKELTQEEQIERLMNDGQGLMASSRWDDAAARFDEVLKLSPDHVQAKMLKEQAQREAKAADTFDAGVDLKGKGSYEEARKKLQEVPEGTSAHSNAQKELKEIDSLFTDKLKGEGQAAFKDKDFLTAHQKLVKAASIKCDAEIKDLITEAESAMSGPRYRKTYADKWEPFKAPPSCR
jgi:pSer/pThr/pTyr-binding forkhead associated (FHA) protein